jgi:1-deoxy-D-xylulose-5-phosphate synthase
MLEFAINLGKPVAIRYPKDKIPNHNTQITNKSQIPNYKIELGKAEVLREGDDFAIVALGSMVASSLEAIELLEKEGLSVTLVNARFVKPVDRDLFKEISTKVKFIFTIEEGILNGGFGSAVSEAIDKPVIKIGLPCEFISHGEREILLEKYSLTAQGIADRIKDYLCQK